MPRSKQFPVYIPPELDDALNARLAELRASGDNVSRNGWINRVIRYQLAQPVTIVETEEKI